MVDTLIPAHGGNICELERAAGGKVLDCSASINPLGIPRAVRNRVFREWNRVLHYPDSEGRDLKERIARYWDIAPENVLLGNGSADLIYLVCRSFRPARMCIPAPSFSEYERAAVVAGSGIVSPVLAEGDEFRLPGDLPPNDCLFLGNPNNPTGNLLLERPLSVVRENLLVVDEAFMDFLPREKEHTCIYEAVRNPRVIVLRTFTKFFALPGLRIGYLIAHRHTVDFLARRAVPWSTSVLAQIAAGELLGNKRFAEMTRTLISTERDFLTRELSGIEGLKVFPSVANFLLLKIAVSGLTSGLLRTRMLSTGVAVRDCGNFRNLDGCFVRVAVRTRRENRRLVSSLREALDVSCKRGIII